MTNNNFELGKKPYFMSSNLGDLNLRTQFKIKTTNTEAA